MQLIKITENTIEVNFTKNELAMLVFATNGPTFKGTKNRDIPALSDWYKEEALVFEAKIVDAHKLPTSDSAILTLSHKEFAYLIKIHKDTMQELDPIEYPTITGYSWDEAQAFLENLKST